jgi:hypothetical protein
MHCDHCGGQVPSGSAFCNHCGARLSQEDEIAHADRPSGELPDECLTRLEAEPEYGAELPNIFPPHKPSRRQMVVNILCLIFVAALLFVLLKPVISALDYRRLTGLME